MCRHTDSWFCPGQFSKLFEPGSFKSFPYTCLLQSTAEILVDKAMALDHIGGVYGGSIKPTPFLCLILKMLQIQPTKDIVVEFIKNADYK